MTKKQLQRTEDRAQLIFEFLTGENLNKPFTKGELEHALGVQFGNRTVSGIRRARELATEAGLHFPTAVPANGFTYMITNEPDNALDPTMHQGRIKEGVRRREDDGLGYMRDNKDRMSPEVKLFAEPYIDLVDEQRRHDERVRAITSDMTERMIQDRRERREAKANNGTP